MTTHAGGRHRRFPDLEGQHGLATTAQLRDAGWTPDAIRHHLTTTWQQVYPGVVAAHTGPFDVVTRRAGAALWAGDAAVLTATVALAAHGLRVALVDTARFLIPVSHRPRTAPDAQTVRTTRPIPIARHLGCVPLTTVARALGDAARYDTVGTASIRAAVISALQRRLLTPAMLHAEVDRSRRNGLGSLRQGLQEFELGAWSLPEAALRRGVLTRPALSDMIVNRPLKDPAGRHIATPDGYLESVGVAVQVHSKTYHSGESAEDPDRWTSTVEADQALEAHGVVVISVTPRTLAHRLEAFLDRLEAVVASHRGRRLPAVIVAGPRPPLSHAGSLLRDHCGVPRPGAPDTPQ